MKYVLKNIHTDKYLHFVHSALAWNSIESAEQLPEQEWSVFRASHGIKLNDGYELVPATGIKYQPPLQRTSFSMHKQKARIQCKKCLGKFGFEEIITHREACNYQPTSYFSKPSKPIKTPDNDTDVDLTPRTPIDIEIYSKRGTRHHGYGSCSGCLNRVYISTKYADTSLGPAFICSDCKAILRPKDAMSYRVGR